MARTCVFGSRDPAGEAKRRRGGSATGEEDKRSAGFRAREGDPAAKRGGSEARAETLGLCDRRRNERSGAAPKKIITISLQTKHPISHKNNLPLLQNFFLMKYTPPSKNLFIKNRKKFLEKMEDGTIAVFFSNDLVPSNADMYYPFEQDSNFYYLTGIDQENSMFIIGKTPDFEVLYIPYTDEHTRTWDGDKLTTEQAYELSGIKDIQYFLRKDILEDFLKQILIKYEGIYLDFNEHPRAKYRIRNSSTKLLDFLRTYFPGHTIKRATKILYYLRMFKEPEEIEQMKIACNITAETFKEILPLIKPGKYEYEIEAEIWRGFIRRRATKHAYTPIIATGKNACVLHYISNNSKLEENELILMDFGAEYGNYSADLTRTVPTNGKFTRKQKIYYNTVLKTLNYATSLLVPGNTLEDYHKQVKLFLQEELLQIGLLKSEEVKNKEFEALSKYFMHGVSHMLGLDTHDVHTPVIRFAPGMVLTCEPGLYIREENIGIRLENDILITKDGNENLLKEAPIEIEEIESRMQN